MNANQLQKCVSTNDMYRTPLNNIADTQAYDCTIELLLCWFSNMMQYKSVEINCLRNSKVIKNPKLLSLETPEVKSLTACANSHMVISKLNPHVSGTQIYGLIGIKERDILTCLQLLLNAHPLTIYIKKVIDTFGCINGIDLEMPNKIFKYIDFPITSIQNLLTALHLQYIKSYIFQEEGFLVGMKDEYVVCFYGDNLKSFKKLSLALFQELYLKHLITEQFGLLEARNYGFFEGEL